MDDVNSVLLLNRVAGFKWYNIDNIYIKGYFFDKENNFYEKETTCEFFKSVDDYHVFVDLIKQIKGVYTIVVRSGNKCFIACDTTKFFPLFYTVKENQLFIGDDVNQLLKESGMKIEKDLLATLEFKSCSYVLGKKTLIKNVYQLQSNECLFFENNQLAGQCFSFSYAVKDIDKSSYSVLKEKTIDVFEESFKRMINSLGVGGRQVVIPLSGGYDSRFILMMLKKYNYTNVICYTYGKTESLETSISKKAASILGFKWYFIPYQNNDIKGFMKSDYFENYIDFTSNYCSMPFFQEYFAVKYLKESNIAKKDAVFIPGHSGDVLGGSQFIKVIPEKIKCTEVADLLLKSKFSLLKFSKKEKGRVLSSISKNIIEFNSDYKEHLAYSIFENFDIKEKFSKTIFNSANVYAFFGFECRFPYWDMVLLKHFKSIPVEFKLEKKLYDEVLEEYFREYDILFEKELQPTLFQTRINTLKGKIKSYMPSKVVQKRLTANDYLNYDYITKQLMEDMKSGSFKVNENYVNHHQLIIDWYLYYVNL